MTTKRTGSGWEAASPETNLRKRSWWSAEEEAALRDDDISLSESLEHDVGVP
jgi:hypothetical protein